MNASFARLVMISLLLFCFYASALWILPGNVVVKVLDVGQGDSVLIQTPKGKNILIDGSRGVVVLERLEEELKYWGDGFELVIITHPDLDHIEGLVEVFKRYRVDRVLMTGVIHGSALYRELLEIIDSEDLPIWLGYNEMDIQLEEGVLLDIVFPFHLLAAQKTDSPNDTSIVTKLMYGNTSILITGDCELACETAQLMSNTDLDADILVGGHHGSKTSFSLPYLQAVSPDFVVMSNGKDNQFGHPHPETLDKLIDLGIEYKNTSEVGTVTVVSDGLNWSW